MLDLVDDLEGVRDGVRFAPYAAVDADADFELMSGADPSQERVRGGEQLFAMRKIQMSHQHAARHFPKPIRALVGRIEALDLGVRMVRGQRDPGINHGAYLQVGLSALGCAFES